MPTTKNWQAFEPHHYFRITTGICAYEAAQKEACVLPPGSGICVGGDETFFGLPILVMMELSSGYLLTEVEQPNRRYET